MRRNSSAWARRCRRPVRSTVALIEELEDRALLSIGVILADVNPNTTASADYSQYEPDIDIGLGGRIVVAWTHEWSASDTDVRYRRYTSTGVPLEAVDQIISRTTLGLERNPSVSVAPLGNFVIGYDVEESGGDWDVYFDIYDRDGSFQTRIQPFVVETLGQSQIDVAIAPNGTIIVTWVETGGAANNGDIYARLYTKEGNPLGPLVNVAVTAGRAELTPSVAADNNGGFVIAYTVDSDEVAFVRFTPQGVAEAAEQFLNPAGATGTLNYSLPHVGRSHDGRYVVGYNVDNGTSKYGYFNLFSANGVQQGEGIVDAGTLWSLDMDAFGNFVGGTELSVSGQGLQTIATFFDSQGRRGETVNINRIPNGNQRTPSVAMANNLLVGAYYDDNQLGNVEFSVLEQRRDKFGVARPNESGGLTFYLDSNLNAYFDQFDLVFNFGLAGDIVVIGDWNGNGIDKVGVGRPNGTGGLTFYLDFNGNRTFDVQDAVYNFGLVGDIIVVGDWNNDGVDDLGVARPNGFGGLVFSLDSNGNRVFDPNDAVFNFGLASDSIVVGDWNGDGFDELGVARPNNFGGLTFSLDSNGSRAFEANQDAVFNFGLAGDRIVVGDWDGDGVDGLGVARPNSGGGLGASLDWNENFTFDATDALFAFDFGLPADILVVGKWAQTALPLA